MSEYNSPLHETVGTTPTDLWNDSCAAAELSYAVENGATGATTNPTIVLEVLRKERDLWAPRIGELLQENPCWCETQVTWQLIEEMAVRGAGLLEPIFRREQGRKGRLSIQTNPALYSDAEAIVAQARHFAGLAPNIQVKIPVTRAGLAAIEAATEHGVNINATVCFSVPQALAVAEAVERGLDRRAAQGGDVSGMTPVCTIMVGRLDDWLKVVHDRDALTITPGHMDWAGIACIKRADAIYRERGYRTRLLAAAYRHHMHWSELIGGDVILTITHEWQRRLNASSVVVEPRFGRPVDPAVIEQLAATFPDFRRAYDPDGMTVEEFDTFGATVRTLRGFIASYHDLIAVVRDHMLPNPDVKPAAASGGQGSGQ